MVVPRQKLPAWYYRVCALTVKEDRDVRPEDFEDLEKSEKSEKEEENKSVRADCECDG